MERRLMRFAALLTAAILLFVLFLVPFGISRELDHDCTGEHCPVCALILACANGVVHLSRTAAPAAAVLVLFAVRAASVRPAEVRCAVDRTNTGIRLLN